jgi:hypothetical protein
MDYVLNQENVLSIREVIRKILYALGMAPSCSFDFSYVHTHTHTHTLKTYLLAVTFYCTSHFLLRNKMTRKMIFQVTNNVMICFQSESQGDLFFLWLFWLSKRSALIMYSFKKKRKKEEMLGWPWRLPR